MNTAAASPASPQHRSRTPIPLQGLQTRPGPRRPFALLGAALAWAIQLGGCGSPGPPQPPSLKLPAPPADLVAARSGNAVTLRWTMPRRSTDRVPLMGDQRAVICRHDSGASAACSPGGELLLQPGVQATYIDTLPAALLTGPPRLLTYSVLLENRRQRGAGPSNLAYSAAGAAPPTIENLRAEAQPNGIQLNWRPLPPSTPRGADGLPADARYLLRLHRTRIPGAGEASAQASQETRAGVPQPVDRTLEVLEVARADEANSLAAGWTLDHAIDQDAALNRTYRYRVERVARVTIDGHSIEISSAGSEPAFVDARDLFPPGVPQGLETVGDASAIDLSWTADADMDLAGYVVYRRVAGSTAPPGRVSGKDLISNAAWRDSSVQPGVRYAYSVSAVDTSGNESARSPEVEEGLAKEGQPAIPAPPQANRRPR